MGYQCATCGLMPGGEAVGIAIANPTMRPPPFCQCKPAAPPPAAVGVAPPRRTPSPPPRSPAMTQPVREIARLRAALDRYGVHLETCHPRVPAWGAFVCTCGLDEARGRKHPCGQCNGTGTITGDVDPITRKYMGPAACGCAAVKP